MPDEVSPSNTPSEGQEATPATTQPVVRKEREQFRALILGNPNYFGNVTDSPFQPVVPLNSDTTFEELKCVGFNPQLNQLEAVVWIKQDFGYGGDLCSPGTPEYVRFYVDWNNTGNFVDQGMTSFTAYDTPGDKPLEYAVTLQITPMEDFCFVENLPTVQAILSWNNPPPPNTPAPAFTPVWGNVLTGRIQIEPFELIIFSKLLEEAKVKLPEEFASALDLSQPIVTAKPKTLGVVERQTLYKDKAVPGHRFAFTEVQQLIANPGLTGSLMAPGFKGFLTELDVNLAELIEELLETDGDTTFEELTCIGLNPNQDLLEGTLTVKLPFGYSGDLCHAGSQEYVAFWIDYGSGFNYVGTTSVNVHDISTIPPEGLQYAVLLPVDFSGQRQPCQDGPKTAHVRAILSWEVPPPSNNPDFVPTWGNQLDTLILITPGPATQVSTSFIDTVGNMAVCDIDQTTGLASGSGVTAAFTANQSPFGGTIIITGFITNAPNVLAGAAPFKYQVSVRQLDASGLPIGPWQPLNNSFTITITQQVGGGLPTQFNLTQSIDPADGFYTYQEQIYTNAWRLVAGRVLAQWQTSAPLTGLWEIRLEAKAADGTPLNAGTILCVDGSTRNTVKVLLDEIAPTAQIAITGFTPGSTVVHPVTDCSAGPTDPATDCGKFQVGDVIFGTYSSFDEHFNLLTLSVLPSGNAVNPSSRAFPVVPTTGESGTWCLDTTGMAPCGYVVFLETIDRTIVNSGFIGFTNSDSKGFCLEAAMQTTP